MLIEGTNAADTLIGTSGNDEISGAGGNDVIDGGAGMDRLLGGSGNNTYRFGNGDGADTIEAYEDATDYTGDESGKLNTLEFKSDVQVADVTVARVGSGSKLLLMLAGGASVTVSGFFTDEDPWNDYNPLQRVRFADGTEWNLRALIDRAMVGSKGADLLTGTDHDDTLDGGEGDDQLDGGAGNDTYLFGPEDGSDWLSRSYDSTGYTGDASGKLSTLRFKDGVDPADVSGSRSGDELVVSILGAGTFTVTWFYAGDDPLNDYNPLQQAVFADGTVWDLRTLSNLGLAGGSADDTLTGTRHDDILDGGAGNDLLNGGAGNDTYRFGLGDGTDRLGDFFDTRAYTGDQSGKFNTLAFKAGVLPASVSASRDGADLVLRLSSTDTFTAQSFFLGHDPKVNSRNPLQQASFADGTVWDIDALVRLACTGSTGADKIVGTVYDDTIDGRAGADELDGAGGNDTYLFGFGDGNDRLKSRYDDTPYTGDADGRLNTLQLKEGVTPSDVLLTRYGEDLEITLLGTDRFTAESFYGGTNPATHTLNVLQQLRFADGQTWDMPTMVAMTARPSSGSTANDDLSGTAGVDTISALEGRDLIRADAGNDAIDGGSGIDTVVYSAARGAYAVTRAGAGFKVAALAGSGATEDTDQLRNVERLQFSDGGLALDLDGQAGQVAKILGAVFGAAAIGNRAYAGAGLSMLAQGLSYQGLAEIAMAVAGKTAHADIVELLWNNVVGTPISPADRASFVGQLDEGLPVGALVVMAADTALNATNIDLAGLAGTGLAYE